MKKAVFLDIDGTLMDCFKGINEIRPKVKELIKSIQSRGDYAFIATGRPYAFLTKDILEFGFDGFVLANGAHVIINGKTIYSKPISKTFIKELALKLDSDNIQYVLEGKNYSYINKNHEEIYNFYRSIGVSEKYLKREYDIDDIEIYKAEALCPTEESINRCLDFIDKNPEYDYFSSIEQKYFEIYFKENTKAVGILKVLEYLNISIENTYAFGDGKNDIEMLSVVGCGIAMGNASDEVKKYADKVTETVHNDGVALGIEKYIIA